MKMERKPKLIVWSLSIALLCAVAALAYVSFQNFWWRKCTEYYADRDGGGDAVSTFQRGHLLLRMIEGENDNYRFSGRKEGPFEIWLVEYHSDMPAAWHYAQRRNAEEFNRQMRYMHDHPDRFKYFGSDADMSVSNTPSPKNR